MKWIETDPLATVAGRQIIRFMWKNILTQFGTSKVLISDNDMQFKGSPFKKLCKEKQIHCRFTAVTHPQVNVQTKVSNTTMMNGLKKHLIKKGPGRKNC